VALQQLFSRMTTFYAALPLGERITQYQVRVSAFFIFCNRGHVAYVLMQCSYL